MRRTTEPEKTEGNDVVRQTRSGSVRRELALPEPEATKLAVTSAEGQKAVEA
jgi:hypothetical protein